MAAKFSNWLGTSSYCSHLSGALVTYHNFFFLIGEDSLLSLGPNPSSLEDSCCCRVDEKRKKKDQTTNKTKKTTRNYWLVTDPPSAPLQIAPICQPSLLNFWTNHAISKWVGTQNIFTGRIFCKIFSFIALEGKACKQFNDHGKRSSVNEFMNSWNNG